MPCCFCSIHLRILETDSSCFSNVRCLVIHKSKALPRKISIRKNAPTTKQELSTGSVNILEFVGIFFCRQYLRDSTNHSIKDWRSRQMWLFVLCQEHTTDVNYQSWLHWHPVMTNKILRQNISWF
jgi:hypothetical protein